MSRIGRAIIEVLLKTDAAKAGAAAVKAEMQGVKTAAAGATQSAEQVGVKGQQSMDRVRAASERAGPSLGKVDRAFDLIGRNAGKGLDRLGGQLETSNVGFTRMAGAAATFVGQVASIAGVAGTFYTLGATIRDAFDPVLRNERFRANIAEMTAATQQLNNAFSFQGSLAGLDNARKTQLQMLQSVLEASKADQKAFEAAMNTNLVERAWKTLMGQRTWSGEAEALEIMKSANLATKRAKDAAAADRMEVENNTTRAAFEEYNRASVQMLDRLEDILARNAEQQRQIAEAQLGGIAVSVRGLNQVISTRMRTPPVSLGSP